MGNLIQYEGSKRFLFSLCFMVLTFCYIGTSHADHVDQSFENWIKNFKKIALKNGITEKTYDDAFKNVHSPDPDVLKKANYQPEFTQKSKDYIGKRVNTNTIEKGAEKAKEWDKWLKIIEARFGVPSTIVLAIWSMETNYGAIFDKPHILKDAIRSLATLAYSDSRYKKYGRTQLLAALNILQKGKVKRENFIGSWAGALGHTQFIPTSYELYGVDIDDSGHKDIWNSVPDALGTAANLLKQNGWKNGLTWGYEVNLPSGPLPKGEKTFEEWKLLGVKRKDGKAFPDLTAKAKLKIINDGHDLAFLVTNNFSVIRCYNRSDLYALSVALLADGIRERLEK